MNVSTRKKEEGASTLCDLLYLDLGLSYQVNCFSVMLFCTQKQQAHLYMVFTLVASTVRAEILLSM